VKAGTLLFHYQKNIKGLDAFIDFLKKDMLGNIRGNLYCPYKHCKNEKKISYK
jgi:hypothetical protein